MGGDLGVEMSVTKGYNRCMNRSDIIRVAGRKSAE